MIFLHAIAHFILLACQFANFWRKKFQSKYFRSFFILWLTIAMKNVRQIEKLCLCSCIINIFKEFTQSHSYLFYGLDLINVQKYFELTPILEHFNLFVNYSLNNKSFNDLYDKSEKFFQKIPIFALLQCLSFISNLYLRGRFSSFNAYERIFILWKPLDST